jgi:hypothetical protein
VPLPPGGNNGCAGVPEGRRRKYNTTALPATATASATAAAREIMFYYPLE